MGLTEVAYSELKPNEVGRLGEYLCASWLGAHGMDVLEHNWRCSAGEADIIADDSGERVFVEVKTRLSCGGPDLIPEQAVDSAKLARYRRMVDIYLGQNPDVDHVRIDVAGVTLTGPDSAHMHYLKSILLDDF